MSSPFQVASLVDSPIYPNSIAWSEENLIAVAAGHLVTILNPEQPHNPRGVITLKAENPFPIGTIDRKDLLSGCLLPTCLSRDQRPCVRSISWSPIGFSPNSGCLLAVCTTEGRVKIYRQPYCEFQAEWVEITDVSVTLHGYFVKINYGEPEVDSPEIPDDSSADKRNSSTRRGCKRRREKGSCTQGDQLPKNIWDANVATSNSKLMIAAISETAVFPSSVVQEGSSVEVFKLDGQQRSWIAGRLERFDGSKALVQFPETDAIGKQEWFEMEPGLENSHVSHSSDMANEDNSFPRIRPSMNVGNLPKEIFSTDCQGVDEILKVGQMVEALTNDRWVEGLFVGLHSGSVLFKPHGDDDAVTLDASFIRLAPSWVREEKLWKVTLVGIHMKDKVLSKVAESRSGKLSRDNMLQIVLAPEVKKKPSNNKRHNCNLQLITAPQYATRSGLLASIAVAWSPVLQLPAAAVDASCDCYSLLAVGAKSGKVSIWRISRPLHYTVEHGNIPISMVLVGLLQAHNTWVTSLSWGTLNSDATNPQLLLATGSSDGSVKIWLGSGIHLQISSEANPAPFSLLTEVLPADPVPVSALSLNVPLHSTHNILLAIGKGSGSFEVCTYNPVRKQLKKVGSYDVHDYAVTGLAWAFDGYCLYSCSQDNSLHGWVFHKGSLSEAPIPLNILGIRIRNSADLPSVYDSCFGVAVSPGNLAVAVVRSLDRDMLHPMYQARTQRAAVEFFWIGGQQLNILSNIQLDLDAEVLSGFPEKELVAWGSNILWSLNQYERQDKHLVAWDIMAALLAFRQRATKFIDHILSRWLSIMFGGHLGLSSGSILSDASRSLSNIASRQLHLLNIFCRRVILSEFKADKVGVNEPNSVESCDTKKELWMKLLQRSERELRERLVGFSLSATLCLEAHLPSNLPENGIWNPVGIIQMVQWVSLDRDHVQDQLGILASEVGRLSSRHISLKKRIQSSYESEAVEQCSYCSAPVIFDSAEVAFCHGVDSDSGITQRHKLSRCAISMQICPVTPTWFCICCQRWASKMAPQQLHVMPCFPQDFTSYIKSLNGNLSQKPLCPFCGILLQRLQPGFLLSISPI
ncbi:hypothetical protein Ancab_008984 [Ancistrocladus abbreviatus]